MHTTENVRQTGRRRHSAEFKADMVAACKQLGISIASVALAHGLNANLLCRWIIEHKHSATAPPRAPTLPDTAPPASPANFVLVTVNAERSCEENIRVELHHGATTVTVTWPMIAAADCAAWLRELLQ